MFYCMHGGVRKTPSGHLLPQSQTNRLPNRPYRCGAALSGVAGDDDAVAPFGDGHTRPPIPPG